MFFFFTVCCLFFLLVWLLLFLSLRRAAWADPDCVVNYGRFNTCIANHGEGEREGGWMFYPITG